MADETEQEKKENKTNIEPQNEPKKPHSPPGNKLKQTKITAYSQENRNSDDSFIIDKEIADTDVEDFDEPIIEDKGYLDQIVYQRKLTLNERINQPIFHGKNI